MKTLYLLRHAKADRTLNDLKRELTAKGRRQAEDIGQWMSENGTRPDLILSSPAKRTKLTAQICAERIDYRGSIHWEGDLYETGSDKYLAIIAGIKNKYDSVLIVGHNPTISAVATMLTGEPLDMSPGMLVSIEIAADKWHSVQDAKAQLQWVQVPS